MIAAHIEALHRGRWIGVVGWEKQYLVVPQR